MRASVAYEIGWFGSENVVGCQVANNLTYRTNPTASGGLPIHFQILHHQSAASAIGAGFYFVGH